MTEDDVARYLGLALIAIGLSILGLLLERKARRG